MDGDNPYDETHEDRRIQLAGQKGENNEKKQKPRKMEKAIVEKQQYKKDRTVEGNQEKERKAERKQTETIT